MTINAKISRWTIIWADDSATDEDLVQISIWFWLINERKGGFYRDNLKLNPYRLYGLDGFEFI